MAQIRGELQREKFIKSISFDNQQINNNRVAVPVGDEEIDDAIMEPPELDVNDNDIGIESDSEHNEDNEELDEFIKLWFEGLDEEDINEDISYDEIDEDSSELNELLNSNIHPADNNDVKWDLITLFKSQLVAPSFFSNMSF
jgi:hypothetical protein